MFKLLSLLFGWVPTGILNSSINNAPTLHPIPKVRKATAEEKLDDSLVLNEGPTRYPHFHGTRNRDWVVTGPDYTK